MNLQHQLKELLIHNTGEVLQQLRRIYAANTNACNQVVMLNQRYERLQTNLNKGIISNADENLEINTISAAILKLIDFISPEEEAAYALDNSIFQLILVVCKTPDREQAMRKLLPRQYYKGIEFDISGQPRPEESVNRFELVVFDNSPHGEKDDPHDLLRYYLDHTSPLMLYFGAPLQLLYQYPEKAYFANSPFSIHARIQEMIGYLKFMKPY
ncbi:MAG: hypothetical protein IAE84_03210 [Saprospiraceae bacterium]|nr:hypothetical protein [Saprospiraceae bacterium]